MTQKEIIEKIGLIGYRLKRIGYKDKDSFDRSDYSFREWELPKDNASLFGGPFYYLQEDDFIHFTSIESVESILKTKKLRLYNLVKMDDKYELKYAARKLKLGTHNSKHKREIYCLSMCSSKNTFKNEENEHLLWKIHGRDGNGAIIRFKLRNNIIKWHKFYLSQIFYDLKLFEFLKLIPSKERKDFLDPLPASFIKLPIYSFENEVRLLFDNRVQTTVTEASGEISYPIISSEIYRNKRNVKYFELPLLTKLNEYDYEMFHAPSFDGINYELPKIEMTEIILGYRHSKSKIDEIKSLINNDIYSIKVSQTKIAKYF